jgi:hypothetical protein
MTFAPSLSSSPAKAGAQSRAADWLSAARGNDNLPDRAPARVGEGELAA